MNKPLLTVRNLYAYRKKRCFIKNLNFQVEKNEIVGIAGESGCGKTTFAHSLLQLDPTLSCEGEALLNGQNLLSLSSKELKNIRSKQISMIFQDPNSSLNPTMKIGKQIREVFIHVFSMTKKEAKNKTLLLMEKVGIPSCEMRYYQYPHGLSGGLKQRVMIAIAIAANPSLIIADEPTTALDVTIQAQILKLFKSFSNMSMIFISHDIKLLFHLCDRIYIMHEKTIVEENTPKKLFSSKHPYTQKLMEASFRKNFPLEALCKN